MPPTPATWPTVLRTCSSTRVCPFSPEHHSRLPRRCQEVRPTRPLASPGNPGGVSGVVSAPPSRHSAGGSARGRVGETRITPAPSLKDHGHESSHPSPRRRSRRRRRRLLLPVAERADGHAGGRPAGRRGGGGGHGGPGGRPGGPGGGASAGRGRGQPPPRGRGPGGTTRLPRTTAGTGP